MKVLFLGPAESPIFKYLFDREADILGTAYRVYSTDADIIVSHGYRYKVSHRITRSIPCINCHISLLPWNRGADPNLWSWVDDTPKGVSIHRMDNGIDTGPILAQEQVAFDGDETLRTSYEVLQNAMLRLFSSFWSSESLRMEPGSKAEAVGSFHRRIDKRQVAHLLTEGWDTPVKKLIGALKAA